jgi:hypothetical protein
MFNRNYSGLLKTAVSARAERGMERVEGLVGAGERGAGGLGGAPRPPPNGLSSYV